MTSQERVEAAMRLQEADRVPVWIRIIGGVGRVNGVKYGEILKSGELAARCALDTHEMFGDDFLYAFLDTLVDSDGFGQKSIFLENEAGYADREHLVIQSPDDYARLKPYDVTKAARCRELIRMAEIMANERGSKVPVIAIVQEPLVTLGNMRGIEKLLVDCLRCPDAVRQGVEAVTDVIIDLSRALIKVGVTYMLLCHDYGNRRMLSEKQFLSIEKAGLARWHKAVKETGARIVVHSCGPTPYIDATFTIGEFDCFQCCYLPQGCASWAEYKQKYGRRICLMGPLVPTEAAMMKPAELKEECRKHIATFGKGGGYILAPGCEFPGNASMLNYKALVDAAREYGQYEVR
jgi:uroporphyrinogen decarboxylase